MMEAAVENTSGGKPYLGGYRHKETGVVYHHASSQSVERGLVRPVRSGERLRHRDTQTYETKSRSTQNYREYGTQMERSDLKMDTKSDREVKPGPYFTADQLQQLKKRKALIIERYWRGYVARSRSWRIRQRLFERQEAEERAKEAKEKAIEEEKQYEIERRLHPQSKRDFELLYNELQDWRLNELKRIHEIQSQSERKAQMSSLLAKETKALQSIDRLKATAALEGRSKRLDRVMDLMATPKRWQLSNGEITELHTPYTTRAQELRDLYRTLANFHSTSQQSSSTSPSSSSNSSSKNNNHDQRLEALLNVKWTVQEFHCPLTHDIVELCDREADLLSRGRPEKALFGLRKRISNLFLQFIETPDFNPEAARFLKAPNLAV